MTEEKVLSKEDIINCEDLPLEKIHVKEWKGSVYIKPISLEERIKWEGSMKPEDPSASAMTLLVYSLCDEAGRQLFEETELAILKKKNAAPILRLFKVAQRVSRLRAKDIEEEIKNSESIPQD